MDFSATESEVAAAKAYEQLHVPALFRQWAPRVAEAARVEKGERVLDVACGTGVLAREVARRLAGQGYVAGLDANAGMLTVAKQRAPEVEWRQGTAESLPFEPESFDAVVSQFGLMFFTDRGAALEEMRRVLAPRGRVAVAVWDALENSEAYPQEVELLDRIAGRAAADALRAPFVLGDKGELVSLFRGAGFSSVEAATIHGTARFPDIRTMVEADLRGWLPVMGVELAEEQIERILAEAERVLSHYVTSAGTVEFDAPAHIVTGKKSPA